MKVVIDDATLGDLATICIRSGDQPGFGSFHIPSYLRGDRAPWPGWRTSGARQSKGYV
jgi:hypothetical protein